MLKHGTMGSLREPGLGMGGGRREGKKRSPELPMAYRTPACPALQTRSQPQGTPLFLLGTAPSPTVTGEGG